MRVLGTTAQTVFKSAIRNPQSAILLVAWCTSAAAQPTYRLEVRPFIKPQAALTLEGTKVKRSAVNDDPGFRLQYHIKKDGKSVATIEARSQPVAEIPQKQAGTYTVVLELFYPTYKPGNAQKGQFKAISNVLTYRLTPAAKPDGAARVELVEPPAPVVVLAIQCGKANGKAQEAKIAMGFSYKLVQGTLFDAWPKAAAVSYCWMDPKEVRFELTVPANTRGMLRLYFADGDNKQRKQTVFVQGKGRGEIAGFSGAGKKLEVNFTPAESAAGKIEVRVQSQSPVSAVISGVELIMAAVATR